MLFISTLFIFSQIYRLKILFEAMFCGNEVNSYHLACHGHHFRQTQFGKMKLNGAFYLCLKAGITEFQVRKLIWNVPWWSSTPNHRQAQHWLWLRWTVYVMSCRNKHYIFSLVCIVVTHDSVHLTCGVPQGSVLGPIFLLYVRPLTQIINQFSDVSHHFYADDLQLYCSLNDSAFNKLTSVMVTGGCQITCCWLIWTRQRLWFWSLEIKFHWLNSSWALWVQLFIWISENMGVTLYLDLSLEKHVNSLVST